MKSSFQVHPDSDDAFPGALMPFIRRVDASSDAYVNKFPMLPSLRFRRLIPLMPTRVSVGAGPRY